MSALLGYARVSTAGQDLAAQRLRLEQAGAVRVFEDVISGRVAEPPGLGRLLDYARPGDSIVVVRLDRLGRSLGNLIDLVGKLRSRGLGLTSLEERLDTTTAGGELVFHVFGALAQFERRLISDRTRDGLAAARARGRYGGRPFADPDRVAAALNLVDVAGLSPTKAAEAVGLGRSTVYDALRLRRSEPSKPQTL